MGARKSPKDTQSSEQMLLDAQAELERILANEEADTAAMLRYREAVVSWWWYFLAFAHPICLAVTIIPWVMFLKPPHVFHYIYNESTIDIIISFILRAFFALLALLSTTTDENRHYGLNSLSYWVTVAVFFANIAKLMVLNWSIHDLKVIVFVIWSMLVSLGFLIAHTAFAPLDEDNLWNEDDDAKEATAKRLKLHQEACERSDATARRLSGEALAHHLEQEAQRVKAFEHTEKQIQRAKITQRQMEKMSYTDLLRFLHPYFWPRGIMNRFIVFFSWVLLGGSKICSVIAPLYIGYATDQLVDDKVMPWRYLATFVSLQLASQILKQIQNAIYLKVKQAAFVQISSGLLSHVLSLSLTFHHQKSLGKLVRSIDRGLNSADNVVSYLFLLLLPSVAEACSIFIVFYTKYHQPLLASVLFLHLVVYAIVTVQLTIIRKPLRKKAKQYDNKYHDILVDALTSIDTVKTFASEQYEVDRYSEAIGVYQGFSVTNQIALSILNCVQQTVIQSTVLCGLLIIGWEIAHGRLQIGALGAVSSYIVGLYSPLSFLSSIYDMVIQSLIECGSVVQIQRIEPEVTDCENAEKLQLERGKAPVVEFRNVSFAYDAHAGRGVKNVNLVLPAGTSTALVGHTGSGKSTMSRLLLRFYDPQAGSILINGQDIRYVTNTSLKAAISVVPQDTILFNDTILNNLRYGHPDATLDEIYQACEAAGILQFTLDLPRQFEEKVGERGLKLSGGEKQRYVIARTLLKAMNTQKQSALESDDGFAHEPVGGIVLADEMTSAVDILTEKKIQNALARLQTGTTSLIIAHRLTTIKHCDNIVVMQEGQILEQGSHDELLARGGRYAMMWEQQFTKGDEAEALNDESQLTPSSHRPSPLTFRSPTDNYSASIPPSPKSPSDNGESSQPLLGKKHQSSG